MLEFDNDGDGVIAKDDCDDNNPDRFPGNTDAWYDGIDSNCDGKDDYDADQDGYVRVGDKGNTTEDVPGTGLNPGGDCHDEPEPDGEPCPEDATLLDDDGRIRGCMVNPKASDTWYDGIDSNCDGKDDYDQDEDGYASKAHSDVYGETLYADGSGSLNDQDCDDERSDVHPGADDAPLDGEDSDCAGNDDFDIDNDGFYSDVALFYQPTVYAEDTTGTALEGDCDDGNASMNPNATDIPYDGIDSDCMGNDDYDQDQDGFVRDVDIEKLTYPIPASGDLPGGDCNDDPAEDGFNKNPAVVEVLSNTTDHDCDGEPDTFWMTPLSDAVGFDGETLTEFSGVHQLSFAENTSGIHLIVGAEANSINTNGIVHRFSFSSSDPLAGVADESYLLEGSSVPSSPVTLSPTVSTWVDEEVLLSATGATFPSSDLRTLYIRGRDEIVDREISLGGGPFLDEVGLAEWNPMTSVSMLRDADGNLHTVGCDPITEVVQYTFATPEQLSLGEDTSARDFDTVFLIDHSATICALIERDGHIVLLNDHEDILRAHTIELDIETDTFGLIEEPESPIEDFHSDWIDSDVDDTSFDQLLIPRQRLPEDEGFMLLVVDNEVTIINDTFHTVEIISADSTIRDIDAVFSPDNTLHIIIIDDSGVGSLYQLPLDGTVSEATQLGTTGLRQAAIWIDEATANTLQIVATTDPDGTVDPLIYGTAYLTPTSD